MGGRGSASRSAAPQVPARTGEPSWTTARSFDGRVTLEPTGSVSHGDVSRAASTTDAEVIRIPASRFEGTLGSLRRSLPSGWSAALSSNGEAYRVFRSAGTTPLEQAGRRAEMRSRGQGYRDDVGTSERDYQTRQLRAGNEPLDASGRRVRR